MILLFCHYIFSQKNCSKSIKNNKKTLRTSKCSEVPIGTFSTQKLMIFSFEIFFSFSENFWDSVVKLFIANSNVFRRSKKFKEEFFACSGYEYTGDEFWHGVFTDLETVASSESWWRFNRTALRKKWWFQSFQYVSSAAHYPIQLENATRRAQIPRKPLDPPISWMVTQSLIFQVADHFCVCVHNL